MSDLRNASGLPLASVEWLETHHRAKLAERRRFAEKLAAYQPARIIDLGCGPGLWLELLDQVMPAECGFVGVDVDEGALAIAGERARSWKRPVAFEQQDIETAVESIDAGAMTLAFNVFPYLQHPEQLVRRIAEQGGSLAVRQYDGAALRFGPMETSLRSSIEGSLRASAASSDQFKHYDMDRTFATIALSPFVNKEIDFELFARVSLFSGEFLPYFEDTLAWTHRLLSDDAAAGLQSWLSDPSTALRPRYFYEVDLTAVLS